MKLIIGDITEYLSDYAKSLDKDAYLIDQSNFDQEHTGVIYTSFGDLSKTNLFSFILNLPSHCEIEYHPPDVWSDDDLRELTEKEIQRLSFYRDIKGADDISEMTRGYLLLEDERKTDDKQLWVAGCSYTFGLGVKDSENWPSLVKKQLGLPMSSLSYPGSSLRWASDQILRSDIRRDDLVIWGLTSWSRFPSYSNMGDPHVNISSADHSRKDMSNYYDIKKMVMDDVLIDDGIVAIQNVINFCRKIGARLILVGLLDYDDFRDYIKMIDGVEYLPLHQSIDEYIDYGSDDRHPGPKQHAEYAKRITEWIHTQS